MEQQLIIIFSSPRKSLVPSACLSNSQKFLITSRNSSHSYFFLFLAIIVRVLCKEMNERMRMQRLVDIIDSIDESFVNAITLIIHLL